ncbi:MAG: hypothetical protein JEZ07_08980 [Phycisphaerae bacterium]|nr:hypothetical protein [Phycisphaerae bacterium]
MSITIEEKYGSPFLRRGLNASATLVYLISGTASEFDAISTLAGNAPTVFSFMQRKSYSVKPISNTIWEGRADYGANAPDTSTFTTSFDTTGGTQHITQSLENLGNYAPAGKTAPDFMGAIGVTKNSVQGVDVPVPVFKWQETHYITNANDNALVYRNLTGCTNDAAFRGFAAGEVRFLGASGEYDGASSKWRVTFKFESGVHITNLAVGDITVTAKPAWAYLWVRHGTAEDNAANTLVQRPMSAHVELVSPDADFSSLGIGVA